MSELQQGMHAFQSTPESWTRISAVEEATPILSGEDSHMVRRALVGDANALSTLFTRYRERLYRTCFWLLRNKEDAEDALQDGLLSAYMNLRSFEGRSQFATWLTRVVMYAALMKRRKLRARPSLALDEFDTTDGARQPSIGTNRPDPEELVAQSETRDAVLDAINQLSPPLRSAFRRRHIQGLSTQEAARAEGVNINVLKSRLLRARRRLVSLLDARGVTPASCSFSSKTFASPNQLRRLDFNRKEAGRN
jgi:RNA polymerase sigma-70 factor (ECF subfamily)